MKIEDDVTVTGNDVNVTGDVIVDVDVGFHVVQTSDEAMGDGDFIRSNATDVASRCQ